MITLEDLRTQALLDCFADANLEELSTQLADLNLNANEQLFFEGEPAAFYVLLEGAIEPSHLVIRKRRVIGTYKAGDCLDDVSLLLDLQALLDAGALTRGRMARLDQHLPSELARDKSGFLLTGRDLIHDQEWNLDREPMGLETSLPKVFAAGDVRHGLEKRVALGVGEGNTGISFVHQVL